MPHDLASDNQSIEQQLTRALSSGNASSLVDHVRSLSELHGDRVYKVALQLLVGKHFGAELAKEYWMGALEHCKRIFLPQYASEGFRAGLLDFLHRHTEELSDPRVIEAEYLENITRSSVTDGLTGLYHQTYLKQILKKMTGNHRRTGDQSFALILFDLDHFKQYNDRCGHLYGDEALRRTAEIIASNQRVGDIAARYGGEEFALLLPSVDRQTALLVAERIRKAIESEPFARQDLLDRGALTISGGVALFPVDGESPDDVIHAADRELYKAKIHRNTIFSLSDERRRNRRYPVRTMVEYASFDGALFRPALAHDISEQGIAIGCDNFLEAGTTLTIRLTRPFWADNLNITAVVRQARRKDNMYFVGLEFNEDLETLASVLSEGAFSAAVHQ